VKRIKGQEGKKRERKKFGGGKGGKMITDRWDVKDDDQSGPSALSIKQTKEEKVKKKSIGLLRETFGIVLKERGGVQ